MTLGGKVSPRARNLEGGIGNKPQISALAHIPDSPIERPDEFASRINNAFPKMPTHNETYEVFPRGC